MGAFERLRNEVERRLDDQTSEQIGRFFTFFGVAAFNAQILEMEVRALLAGHQVLKDGITSDAEIGRIFERVKRRPLNQVLKHVAASGLLSANICEQLHRARSWRNELVHNCLESEFMTLMGAGRFEPVTAKCRALAVEFDKLSGLVRPAYVAMLNRLPSMSLQVGALISELNSFAE